MGAVELSSISQEVACVPLSMLKITDYVDHHFPLGELLNHIKFICKEQSIEQGYVPINFITVCRTCYSNLVIERDREDGTKRYYLPLVSAERLLQIGYDYAMMIVKSALLERYFDTTTEDRMKAFIANLPDFIPVGLFNPNPQEVLPCAVFQCVFRDDSVTVLEKLLRERNRFVKIDDMKREGNFGAILDTLFNIVRKDGE